jgi:hypothetical protein
VLPEKRKNNMANQQMRFDSEELDLIKRTFKGNESLLKSIRKVMLQLPLDVIDQTSLLVLKKEDLKVLIRKVFLPELDGNSPLGQQIDLYMTVNLEGKSVEEGSMLMKSRQILIDYIEQQLETLNSQKVGKIVFKDLIKFEGKSDESIMIDTIARNTMVGHVENQLIQLKTLSEVKDETPEEQKERLEKDSSK